MADFPRDLPHLYLRGSGRPEPYTSKTPPPRHKLPQRERFGHATAIEAALTTALAAAQARRAERDPELVTDGSGFYLDFEIPAGSETAAELLENRQKHIELVVVRQETPERPAIATVFVPDAAATHLLKKVEQYRQEQTRTGKPKNEALVARLENVALSAARSVFTDDPFPEPGESLWWEVWIRPGRLEAFNATVGRLQLPVQPHRLVFPDREVRLVFGDTAAIGRLFLNSDAIAELRRAKDTPAATRPPGISTFSATRARPPPWPGISPGAFWPPCPGAGRRQSARCWSIRPSGPLPCGNNSMRPSRNRTSGRSCGNTATAFRAMSEPC